MNLRIVVDRSLLDYPQSGSIGWALDRISKPDAPGSAWVRDHGSVLKGRRLAQKVSTSDAFAARARPAHVVLRW